MEHAAYVAAPKGTTGSKGRIRDCDSGCRLHRHKGVRPPPCKPSWWWWSPDPPQERSTTVSSMLWHDFACSLGTPILGPLVSAALVPIAIATVALTLAVLGPVALAPTALFSVTLFPAALSLAARIPIASAPAATIRSARGFPLPPTPVAARPLRSGSPPPRGQSRRCRCTRRSAAAPRPFVSAAFPSSGTHPSLDPPCTPGRAGARRYAAIFFSKVTAPPPSSSWEATARGEGTSRSSSAFTTLDPARPSVGLVLSPALHVVSWRKMPRGETEARNKGCT